MFGYIKPYKPNLLVKEYEFYKSAYCGLCKNLGKEYGIIARLSLSYDATFLAMLLLSLNNNCPHIHKERCKANPLKKCLFCFEKEEIMSFAGAVSVIMMYYKLEDDIKDSKFPKKIFSSFLKGIGHHVYKKAKSKYANVDILVKNCMDNQAKTEADNNITMDLAADSTAIMLKELLISRTVGNSIQEKIFNQFGYYIGRWIYLADAADDLEKDKKESNFNPFFLTDMGKEYILSSSNIPDKNFREYCNATLNQTISEAIKAFDLLNLYTFDTILQNTIYQGLPNIQKQILFDKYDKEKL